MFVTDQRNVSRMISLTVFFAILLFVPKTSAQTLSSGLHKDIKYAQIDSDPQLLDAFVPEGENLHPIVIMVHGGGWVGGDKQDMSFLFEPLSDAGFSWFTINYRLAPQHRWPDCVEDVITAIRWVKAHAPEYKGNPNQIALVGYSAGGHLACMAAINEPVNAVVGFAPPTDHLSDSVRREGLSECMQKLLDRPKEIDKGSQAALQKISPVNYVTADLPPFLLIHGTEDQSVAYSQSVNFQGKLQEYGVSCELITIKSAPHRITEWDKFGVDFKHQMVSWLIRTIGSSEKPAVITVSADGSGDFTTVQAAVDDVPDNHTEPTVISIKPGTYKEKIVVPRSKRFVTFRGQDSKQTVLTYNLSARMKDENGKELGTFRTPSVTIEADDFTAENITFENTAGDVGQALAMTVFGDRVVFRNCRFLGWQDTLLDQTGRHYYENCYIVGHCDFIFGGGTAFFEKCHIHCLEGSYITAASTPQHQRYGYVFSNCKITGQPEGSKTYLGRPWRDYASVIFLNTEMADVVRPEGWHNWKKPHRENTARYAEYNSTGPGANSGARVEWSNQLTAEQAKKITIQTVLSGDDGWNPITETVSTTSKIIPASVADIQLFKKKIAESTHDGSAYVLKVTDDILEGLKQTQIASFQNETAGSPEPTGG